MLRKMAVAAALLIVTSPRLFALGLGEINMTSALNQPMQAVIDLTSSAGTPVDTIKVSLASLEAHRRAGLTKSALLANFKFTVEPGRTGNAVVRVTSTDPVREPYLEFMLELEWPNGRLLRQYTLLVDPPVTMPATPSVPPAPVTQAATRPDTPQPVRQVRAPATRAASAPATVSVAPTAADEYGPIRRSETLWSIAERVRPDDSISMHQMMLALLRANPDAFVNGNMNLLKAGATLKVPARDEVVALSAREALAETRRQYSEWKSDSDKVADAPGEQTPAAATAAAQAESAGSARLQLVAPEGDAVEGAAMPGDPETITAETGGDADLHQQLALATEEVEAGKAQSYELQSRVDELEQQIETMKRLLVLKDDALANLQNGVATAGDPAAAEGAAPPESTDETTGAAVTTEAEIEEAAAAMPASGESAGTPSAIMNKVLDNPILAGAGVLVALLLGGFLWLANRRRNTSDMFDEDMTLSSQLATDAAKAERSWPQPMFDVDEPEPSQEEQVTHETTDNNPVTESEVYLAYGRIQQAEDVLQAALQRDPDDDTVRLKLLEVYHIAGNTAAFEQAASDFRDGVAEDDERWIKVATMGYTMAPQNDLYRAGAPAQDTSGIASEPQDSGERQDNSIEFDMDLSGMDSVAGAAADDDFGLDLGESRNRDQDLPETIEYGLDQLDDEDGFDGTLASEDEVTTKLDLARAYIDMDDKDSARSILGEVMEEGNTEQKQEAEKIFSQIA